MVAIDPTEHEIAELGPEVNNIDDVDEVKEMLALEEDGPDRAPVKTLLESRIEALEEEPEEASTDVELATLSAADVGNLVRQFDEVSALEELLEQEADGEDRDTVKRLIKNRIDSVQGGGGEGTDEYEYIPPEEKHPHLDHPTNDKQYVKALDGGVYRDMWVYCETQAGSMLDVSKEILGKGRELMDDYNEEYDADENLVAVIIGDNCTDTAEEAISYGADVAVYHEDERLDRFLHKPYAEIFCDMARGAGHEFGREDRQEDDWRDYDEPRYTVFPATNNGRDLSALVQGELDSGLASDCADLYIEDVVISNPEKTGTTGEKKEFTRVLHMPRPDFSGFEYSTILCIDAPDREFHPQGASVIPGAFELPEPDDEREGLLVEHDLTLDEDWMTVTIEEHDILEGGVDLTEHEVVVCVGRGIGRDPTKGIELGKELAEAFDDAGFGLTRGVITSSFEFAGHVEDYTGEDRQIGESGQVVEPSLYIAAGVSGAVQHKVGCDEADTIISINTDPDADIKEWSDYYIHGDLFDVIPAMIDTLSGTAPESALAGAIPAMGGQSDD